uniref:Uncharacterized protein n=1 Tax=Timema shepardi TaxID=629360 RepID=A0A7R9FZI2_TIMSH|nr:unnamed protein product [Timema shepardi]
MPRGQCSRVESSLVYVLYVSFDYSMGMVKTITMIYRDHGVFRGLYRGMSINYMRAIPMAAVSFSTYELMKQLLNLDTGMKLA